MLANGSGVYTAGSYNVAGAFTTTADGTHHEVRRQRSPGWESHRGIESAQTVGAPHNHVGSTDDVLPPRTRPQLG